MVFNGTQSRQEREEKTHERWEGHRMLGRFGFNNLLP